MFGVAVAVLFFSSLFAHRTPSAVAQSTPEPLPSGYFRPTADQWRSLTIAAIKTMPFGDVTETDGTIAPADDTTTQIFSPFTGRITHVYVTVGDVVRKGTPLFAGEGGEYAQAVNDLVSAQQSLRAARIQLRVTEDNQARLLKLLRIDGAARKDVEQSRADVALALATVKNDQTAVTLVQSRLRVLGETAPAAGTGENSAPALRTGVIVRSPIDGVVTQRAVGAGTFIDSAANGASNPLLTISDLSRVFFVANATEEQIGRIHPGDRLTVAMSAFPGRTYDARVKYISPVVDPSLHRIAVRAEVDNPDSSLKPGMYGRFAIVTGPADTAVGVPEDAVIFEGDTARVWIVGPNHTLALRYFTAGKTVDGIVEALRGLESGDRVVTRGSVFIDRASQGDD
jgi:cobalt-zinc-cadmium efflux system membrane fusion protein